MRDHDPKIEPPYEGDDFQARIGKDLRKIFADLAAVPIPSRFEHLLEPPPDDPPPAGAPMRACVDNWKTCDLRRKHLLGA
jgi:hypothetical protein